MITWALHFPATNEVKYGLITKKEMDEGTFDRRIIRELLEELSKVDVMLTYYGTGFDVPFIRSRVMYWGLQMPTYGSIYHFYLLWIVIQTTTYYADEVESTFASKIKE